MASKSRRALRLQGDDEAEGRRPRKAQRQKFKMPAERAPRGIIIEPLTGKTARQNEFLTCLRSSICTFGIGPAGVGKTYCETHVAAELLAAGKVSRIILTRPALEAGEKLGFLPGTLDEKFGHYIRPLRDVLDRVMGRGYVDAALRSGKIEGIPLALMRGLSIDNAVMLADEMQNATELQTKMLLSRAGEWTRVFVDGDPSQIDLPNPSASGLMDAVSRLEGREGVSVVRFTEADNVRSGFSKTVIEAYAGPRRRLAIPSGE